MEQVIGNIMENDSATQQLVKDLYERYSGKLLRYTRHTYGVNEDDAASLVYKTVYRVAEVHDQYKFENEPKKQAFIFKTHLNYLRNYFRDRKAFEFKNVEIQLTDIAESVPDNSASPKLRTLQNLLDRMEDWQRILLLLRSQDMSYTEIARYVDKPEKQLKVYYARLKKQLLKDINTELEKTENEKPEN